MTPSQLLARAWQRIEDPAKFCTSAIARNEYGDEVEPCDVTAVCWCAEGALTKEAAQELEGGFAPWDYLCKAAKAVHRTQRWTSPATVNDELGHAAVREMYARAIALAQAEEQRTT